MIRLIIFDWDGTIALGASEGYLNCYLETFKKLNFEPTPRRQEIRRLISIGPTHLEELKIIFKVRPELIEPARRIYEQELLTDSFLKFVHLTAGTKELLERLKGKYILTVATGTMKQVVEAVLQEFNLPNVFKMILTHHDLPDVKLAKPNSYLAGKILQQFKIKPDEAIVVGDGAWDIKMAVNAGITPVAVLTGYLTKERALSLGAKFIIPNILFLENILN